MSNFENSKVSTLENDIFRLTHFKVFFSDLNFLMNIYSRNFTEKKLRDFRHIFEQIRIITQRTIVLLKFQQFNQFQLFKQWVSLDYLTLTPQYKIKGIRTFGRFLNSLSLEI